MQFKVKHKAFLSSTDGKKPISLKAHRDGNHVWITSQEKGNVLSKHTYNFVSQAKRWMNSPSTSYI